MTDYNRKQLDYNRSLFLSLFCNPCVIFFRHCVSVFSSLYLHLLEFFEFQMMAISIAGTDRDIQCYVLNIIFIKRCFNYVRILIVDVNFREVCTILIFATCCVSVIFD